VRQFWCVRLSPIKNAVILSIVIPSRLGGEGLTTAIRASWSKDDFHYNCEVPRRAALVQDDNLARVVVNL